MADLIRLNTIFLPGEELKNEVLQLASEISNGNEVFKIDDIDYFTHVSIYHSEFPSRNIDNVLNAVSDLSQELVNVELKFSGLRIIDGYVMLDFEKTQQLMEIQELIINKLNPLREGHVRADLTLEIETGEWSDVQVEYIKKYGHPLVFNSYTPHITLAKFEKDYNLSGVKEILNKINFAAKPVNVSELAVSEEAKYGTCTKIIKKFRIGE